MRCWAIYFIILLELYCKVNCIIWASDIGMYKQTFMFSYYVFNILLIGSLRYTENQPILSSPQVFFKTIYKFTKQRKHFQTLNKNICCEDTKYTVPRPRLTSYTEIPFIHMGITFLILSIARIAHSQTIRCN